MATEKKDIVSKEETFDRLEIRLGRIVSVELCPSAPKPAYKITADFGKFGLRTTVGRFTKHARNLMEAGPQHKRTAARPRQTEFMSPKESNRLLRHHVRDAVSQYA